MPLTLQQCNQIISAALNHGISLKAAPLTVAVVDAGGHLLALQRQDGASNLRPQIAMAKAAGTLALGFSSRKLAEIARDRPELVGAMTTLPGGAMMPSPGGVIIIDRGGAIVGAVGVTGDTSDNDELCAIAGVHGIGFSIRN